MTEHELHAIILAALKRVAPESAPEELAPAENIREALDIDSFTFLRLLVDIGEKTGVEVPESDYGRVATLGDMQRYLASRLFPPA